MGVHIVIPVARPDIGLAEHEAVQRVLSSGMLAQGPEVDSFETEFSAAAVDGRECVAVNSGTSAQHLVMVALGIGPGDEVIVPSFTFAATANCVSFTGATPVFVDIEPTTYAMNPEAAAAAISPRTRAIMPVHLYGHPANLTALTELTARHGLFLVEDAAQAHLATWEGRPVGTWGVAGTFSFYPTKNMTSGEGGMIATGDASLARTIRLLRNQGQERRYENEIVGLNNRMTDLHASIGRAQLSQLLERTTRRRTNAAFLQDNLRGVVIPVTDPRANHAFHQFTIRVTGHDRDRFAEELKSRGVGSGVYYPTPVHRLAAFDLRLDLPETDRAAKEVLSLPVYPSLSEEELEQVVEAVNEVAKAGA